MQILKLSALEKKWKTGRVGTFKSAIQSLIDQVKGISVTLLLNVFSLFIAK
jgi:hypothetical protein